MDQKRNARKRSRKGVMRTVAIVSAGILVVIALITAIATGNLTPILMIVAAAAAIGFINM